MPQTRVTHAGCRFQGVLFDLDGTLVDSAPDLARAANAMRSSRGLARLPLHVLRPLVGSGARGMVRAAFGVQPGHAEFEPLRDEFLARYADDLLNETALFEGMPAVLEALEHAGVPWAIVTNKAERFTLPIVRGLSLLSRAAAVVGGDSTPHSKPHPAPLLEAARRIGVPAGACVYVGDDPRDVVAGRAAGMATLAAAWGYLGDGEAIDQWGADAVVFAPQGLLNVLGVA